MPELPEVETTCRGIEPLLVQSVISDVVIHNPSLRWPVPEVLKDVLPGQRVLSIKRRGKYLLIGLDTGTLILHLGMTGNLRVADSLTARRKHDHVEIFFQEGFILRFNDSRRFGAIFWTQHDPSLHQSLKKLGPEPLTENFDAEYLFLKSRNRKVATKIFIMNHQIVVGVGNIYANEALFDAGISPNKAAKCLTRKEVKRLVEAIKVVLQKAIDAGGTTLRDFTDSQGREGYFKVDLKVYGRDGELCLVCRDTIRTKRLGQRSTFFCPTCQLKS
jgi:formamidopyrimidine-DNA glycosylase